MDRYSLNARIYPIILLYMPVVILGIIFSFSFKDYLPFVTSLGLVGALSFLFSQLGRDSGKKREPDLWSEWGGTPSIQLLRWRDNRIDENSKSRYHAKLQIACPQQTLPDANFEINFPIKADESYMAWTRFLLSKTRDANIYSLLFSENINYGFRRNLWGLKPYALGILIICITGCFSYYALTFNSINLYLFPKHFAIAEITLFLILIFWLIVVRKSWVKIAAFSYAERLVEAAEHN